MADYRISENGLCPTCSSGEVFWVLSDNNVKSGGSLPPIHRFLLRNKRAVAAKDLMKETVLQRPPTMVCASCFSNSGFGGFDINWHVTNLETIFGVHPDALTNEERLAYDLQELLSCGKKTLEDIQQKFIAEKTCISQRDAATRIRDRDGAEEDFGEIHKPTDSHPYMKYLPGSKTGEHHDGSSTTLQSSVGEGMYMSGGEMIYPVSMTGTCPYCYSSDVVYIVLVREGSSDDELPQLLRKLVENGHAIILSEDREQEMPSFQCRQCGYGFNLDWTAASLETVFSVTSSGDDKSVQSLKKVEVCQEGQLHAQSSESQDDRDSATIAVDKSDRELQVTDEHKPARSETFVTQYKDYTIPGNFNILTGKFQRHTESEHWAEKGLPTDRDIRQLAHYMDVRSADTGDTKRKHVKPTAKQIQKFKKEKEEKKRKKLLQAYFDQ